MHMHSGHAFWTRPLLCCLKKSCLFQSIWAFEKLADTKWGVIGLKYRPVPCDYVPAKIAPSPSDPFPVPDAPSGAYLPNSQTGACADLIKFLPHFEITRFQRISCFYRRVD